MNARNTILSLIFASTALCCGVANAETVLNVGATPTGQPFTYLNTKTGQVEGAMVDIVHAVGKNAGFEPKVQAMLFSALINSLTSKRIDLISAAMFVTPARQKIISFSTPVYSYGEGLLVPESDHHDYRNFADMKGLSVGVQVGTTIVEPVQKSGAFKEVKLYENGADMLSDLKAGRIQGAIFDSPIMIYNFARGAYPGMRVVRSYVPTEIGQVAIAMNQGDPALLASINQAIDKMQKDGELAAIIKKWDLPVAP